MHCADPGCLKACPAPGAIVQYANGIVDFHEENCIGCGYCITGCPFNIPRISKKDSKAYKCTLCSDRVAVGLEPACVKTCPTGAIVFGSKEDMIHHAEGRIADLKERGYQQCRAVRPAGRRRHPCDVRAAARRPAGALRESAQGSDDQPAGRGVEGHRQAADEPGHRRWPSLPASSITSRPAPRRWRKRKRIEPVRHPFPDTRSEHEPFIQRYTASERINHWVVAITFILAALSGLALFHPAFFFLTHLFGGGTWTRILHPFIGVVMFLFFIVMAARFWRFNHITAADRQWMKRIGDVMRNRDEDLPELGKYNAGQKYLFWMHGGEHSGAADLRHRHLATVVRAVLSRSGCCAWRW